MLPIDGQMYQIPCCPRNSRSGSQTFSSLTTLMNKILTIYPGPLLSTTSSMTANFQVWLYTRRTGNGGMAALGRPALISNCRSLFICADVQVAREVSASSIARSRLVPILMAIGDILTHSYIVWFKESMSAWARAHSTDCGSFNTMAKSTFLELNIVVFEAAGKRLCGWIDAVVLESRGSVAASL